jgi:PAS domain S-box-containing protein
MPKKPTSKRLDKLFEGMQDEQAKPKEKPKRKATPRPAEKKPAVSAAFPAATRPLPHAADPQTRGLPPLENAAITQRGGSGTPSSLSLAFQMDHRNWATLQVVDETAAREWDTDEQLLVKQVVDQLSQALESARLFQETRSRAEELSVLNEMGRELTSLFSVEAIAKTVHKYASRLMDTTNLFITLFDETRQELTPFYVISNRERIEAPSRPLGNGLTDFVLRTRQPLFIPEDLPARVKELGLDVVTLGNDRLAQCWMGAPLLVGDTVLGVVGVQNLDSPNIFTERHRDLLTAISSQAAIAIQNARLFEETQRRTEELGVLNRIVSSASQMLELETMLNSILRQTMEISRFTGGLVSLFDEKAGKLELITHHNLPQPIQKSLETNGFANTLCEYVYMNRNVLSLPDLRKESPVNAEGLIANNILSYFGVPLETKGRVIGTMCMFNHEPRVIEPRIIELARSIGIQTGFAIENARLFEATQRSEADLRALFASMQDVVMVIDKDTRYVRIAPTNPSRLYRPPTELLGQRMDEILPAETHEPFRKAIQQALEGDEAVQIEYKLDINNQGFWFLANITRLNDREVFWVARDITERKRQEQALIRRNEYLSATAEIGQLVTSTLDMPTLLSRTVNLVRDRFGFYHAGIFVTEETGFRAVLQAATGEAGAEMLRQKHNLQVGSKSIVGEVTEQGRAVVVNDTAASEKHKFNPLLPETRAEAAIPLRVGARIIGALDIQSTTPNAFSEDDIAVLQTLADQVAIAIDNARSYELSMQAVKEMREADKLKSQFLANMSHELRTPLNSIIGFSRVILKGIDGPVTDLQQQDLLAIHNSGQHLLGLINDILDLSRIEAGKMELTFDEVNLSELITSVMSTAAGLVKDKSITLHRDLPADLPTVRADAMRIRQVLLNLLSNAAKFTDEGAITVHASVVDNAKGHPEITVRVTDTGPGISQEDQKKLFQPFSQVDASPTRKSGGSGLGLSISNHLIQMHGGRIGVESEPGKGSTFYFTLPAFRGKPETAAPQSARVILAIDDDPQVISLYERYLQPQGYQVVPLSDPSRAVERVRQLKPFAVTLDIMMPGYDGWHVLNDLKSNAETRNVPVIVCSIVEEQEKGFSLGAADYLVKPILEDDLLNALDRLNDDGSLREILIVDDDPNDLRLIGQMLSGHERYHPVLAEGGQKGWESIQAHTPHAVILDLFMPEMDGFALLEKMRSDDTLRDIPVIVVSGGDLTPDQQKQLQEFGKRMILKHALTKTELVAALERTLERAKK